MLLEIGGLTIYIRMPKKHETSGEKRTFVMENGKVGCVRRVRTDQYPGYTPGNTHHREPLYVLQYIHTRTQNFCKLFTTLTPVPGTSVRSVRPCQGKTGYGYSTFTPAYNFYELCTSVPQHRELLCVQQHFRTRTQNFCKFCKIPLPLPGTFVTSVRLWHNTHGTDISLAQYPGRPVFIQV